MSELVNPSNIPWTELTDNHLEELLFWLLDSMGATELEWRRGSAGRGASDGGRDIEATLLIETADGELRQERWWIECKGRSDTVEASAVKEAAVNTQNRDNIDVLVVATNSEFSNPTRDWIAEWNRNGKRPRVKLWNREALERHVVRHPSAAARLFKSALTPDGHAELVAARFWGQAFYADKQTLEGVWPARGTIAWSERTILGMVASEAANGSLSLRPWILVVPTEVAFGALHYGLVNLLAMVHRADRHGSSIDPYFNALGYVIASLARHTSPGDLEWLIRESLGSRLREIVEDERRLAAATEAYDRGILLPILWRILHDFSEACSADCRRVSRDLTDMSESEAKAYWSRFSLTAAAKEQELVDEAEDKGVLIIQDSRKPCSIDIPLAPEEECPLFREDLDPPALTLPVALTRIKQVLEARVPTAAAEVRRAPPFTQKEIGDVLGSMGL